MRVALLCNMRAEAPAADPDDTFEEYDSPETIAAVAHALGGLGVEVEPVAADRLLPWRLEEGHYDFAFNIAEGQGRRCREAVPAAVCELMGLPFTGSDAVTLGVTLDKWLARRVVSPEVPVAGAALIRDEVDEDQLSALRFPVIVKPNDEGSSKGIRGVRLPPMRRRPGVSAAGCARVTAARCWWKSSCQAWRLRLLWWATAVARECWV